MAYSEEQLERLIKNAEFMGNHWDMGVWKKKLDKLRAAKNETTNDGDSND